MKYTKFFKEISNKDVSLVGGKSASLGEMFQKLTGLGVRIPNGFAITSDAYWYLLDSANIKDKIFGLLDGLDVTNIDLLREKATKIRQLITDSTIPDDLKSEIIESYKTLSQEYGVSDLDVAVRSSATAEDLPDASFAGQQASFLNVKGEDDLIDKVKACIASLFTERAISYRSSRHFDHSKIALSVCVQKMVRSDLGSSGVIFSIDTESGFKDAVFITSIYGLGENIVGGIVSPDEFYVFKQTLKMNKRPIIKKQLGRKDIKMIYSSDVFDGKGTKNIPTSKEEMNSFSITDDDVLQLAKYAVIIEEHYTKEAGEYRPMDIEWAKDGIDGKLYIVQARPETVQSKKILESANKIEKFEFTGPVDKSKVLITGMSVGEKIGYGPVKVIRDVEHMNEVNVGDILVTDNTDPDWEPAMKKAAAIITNRGGRTCHAAIVAREIGVPAIVGAIDATEKLVNNSKVTVSCAEGEIGYVYEGKYDYKVVLEDISDLKPTRTKICMNIGNPEKAFSFSHLPNCGVGLARMELIVINYIKAHPSALVDLYHGRTDIQDYEMIKELSNGYKDAKDFCTSKIAEGIGMIAAAFYPKPVIVRLSDFKTNEYRSMPGGQKYEPLEENPMLGWRGASRYYAELYKEAFSWECIGLSKVINDMGLTNLKVMIPFLRTPEEGLKVLQIMKENGLEQHKNGLEVYVMCELPVNIILGHRFLEIFDGFSIGSNDLTQLTLGVDRDGQMVSHIFDERNPAMLYMFKLAIDLCNSKNKYIGICGQAPSDYLEVAEFLVKNKIKAISLNPDTVVKTWRAIEKLEEKLYK